MHSPLLFFISVMSTFFFAVLITRIFRTPFELFKDSLDVLLSLHSFFFSDAFVYAFAQILQSLFLFFGCASPFLDESQDFSIFVQEFFILFCCCRCDHAHFFDETCLFILMRNSYAKMFFWIVFRMLITVWALFRQSLPCQQVAAAAAATSCFNFMSTFLIFDFHKRVWALILQSLPCRRVPFTAFLFIITPTGCRRPPVLTSMLMLSWNTPLVCYCAAAHHASSFDVLCYSFCKCAFSFCCLDTLCFGFCMSAFSFCCCGVLFLLDISRYFLWRFFLNVSTISWYLSSSSVISILVFFSFCTCSTNPIVSCFLFSLLARVFFRGVLIKKVAMIHLWSLPMWIMSLASASFTFLKYLLLVRICSQFVFLSLLCGVLLNIVLKPYVRLPICDSTIGPSKQNGSSTHM